MTMKVKPLPSRLRLNDLFIYDNAKLLWRADVGPRGKAGNEAGTISSRGYRKIQIDGGAFFAHRLIWKLLYGEDPVDIDHINGDRLDNRITNLRSVTRVENARNAKLRNNNKSGVSGVFREKSKNKWTAKVGATHLGYFNKFEDAVAARKQAEKEYGYHPNHGRGER